MRKNYIRSAENRRETTKTKLSSRTQWKEQKATRLKNIFVFSIAFVNLVPIDTALDSTVLRFRLKCNIVSNQERI